MDEMTIINPKTGKERYLVTKDNQVEDLMTETCTHKRNPGEVGPCPECLKRENEC